MPITTLDLYRAMKNGDSPGEFHIDGEPREGLLYPRFRERILKGIDGVETRIGADVTFKPNPESGVEEVQPKGGTSLHDVSGWFGHADWRYFEIPKGTEYPDNLVLHKGSRPKFNRAKTVKGTHYQIEPKIPMTEDAFKGALDNFARNAVVRSIALATA